MATLHSSVRKMPRDGQGEPAEPELVSAVESILLVAGEPVSLAALAAATEQPRRLVERALETLARRLMSGIRLQRHEGTAQLVTAPENVAVVQRFLGSVKPPPLSRAALETVAVIAYHQPVTRAEIEAARGVDSDSSIRRLVARGLIEERGRRATVGRPAEYGTTPEFLQYFGLTSLDGLPAYGDEIGSRMEPRGLGLRGEPE